MWRRGSSAGSPNASHVGLPDERERQHLDVARLGQGDRHGAAAALRRGEPASGGRGGQLGRDRRRSPPAAAPPRRGRRAGPGRDARTAGSRRPGRARRRPPPARRRSRPGRGAGPWPRAGTRRPPPGRAGPAPSARARAAGAAPTSVRPAAIVPPPCSTSSAATRSAATGGSCGSTARSNRRDASLGSLCRRAARAIDGGVEVRRLDQRRRSVGAGPDLGGRPAHHAREADRAGVVGDEQVVGVETALHVVEGGQRLARLRPPHHDGPGQPRRVVGVQRLAQLEHHVVGDVDDQRDGAHPGPEQPPLHPPRRRRRRVDPVDAAGHEAQAAVVGQRDGPPVTLGGGHRHAARGVDVVHVGGDGELARQPAHGERVAAVGRDVQLDHRVVRPDQRERLVAGLGGVRRQHEDAGVVGPDAELAHRAIMPSETCP